MRVLITGAGRAIGAATAQELTKAGHEVIASAREVSMLDDLDVALRLSLDVTSEDSIVQALDRAGEIDAVLNRIVYAAPDGSGAGERQALQRRMVEHVRSCPAPGSSWLAP